MKKKNFLILDNEFIEYCRLNKIEDIEKMAKKVFNQGFTILKYGEIPKEINLHATVTPTIDITPDSPKKMTKTDLYDE